MLAIEHYRSGGDTHWTTLFLLNLLLLLMLMNYVLILPCHNISMCVMLQNLLRDFSEMLVMPFRLINLEFEKRTDRNLTAAVFRHSDN